MEEHWRKYDIMELTYVNNMFQKILGLILLTSTALAQMDSVRPDISFTDNNDRFDLSGMVSTQNKMLRDTPLVDDDEDEGVASDADYRRDLQNEDTGIHLDAFKAKHPAQAFLTRRDDYDFAYDPDNLAPIGREGNDAMQDLEFQENLNQFKMNIPKPRRRNAPDGDQKYEDDIVMQHVIPIVLNVDGYLKAPTQEITLLDAKQGKKVVINTN